ncbi:MAG: helix-turn-helix transcriptional regulator [Muribaculaceae bacterium]|nr:helix-turn-helix transcriptional regulator [Muribaculaceae bacterium]
MMGSVSRNIVLLFLVLATVLPGSALAPSREHSKWLDLPVERLLDMADKDFNDGGSKDTALMCYTIIANRYEKSMSLEQKSQCKEANMRLWSIYFYDFYDYPKCFDCLTRAREIATQAGIEDANIYLGFGCMYQTISEECGDYELGTKALDYYKQALTVGLKTGDDKHTDMASTDVLAMAHTQGGLSQITPIWNQYLKLPEDNETWILRRYNKLLYQAFNSVEQGRPDVAIKLYNSQLQLIDTTQYSRLIYFTLIEKGKVHAMKGDYRNAVADIHQAEKIAVDLEMKDCKLEVYGMLSRYYKQLGDDRSREHYYNQFALLKDTLTNYQQLASVNEMEFRNELKGMEQEMNEMRQHREVMSIVTLTSLGFLLVLAVLLYLVYRKNGELTRSNESLYQKNVEMLRAEEEERRMRRQLQEKEPPRAEALPAIATAPDDEPEKETTDADAEVKYKSSHLSDEDKQQLLARIQQVMDNSEEIYSADFSLERLAMLSGSKYKYVSQVINEYYQQNFNNFLNSYRIKEACKRMGDVEHYGNYTIEAISESVGFKSRSTFVSSFKRITGLTPSQYQRLARRESQQ